VGDLGRRDEELQVEGLAEREENTEIVVREALASSRNRKRSGPADFLPRNRLASRSHSVRITLISAAPTPIASPVERRVEFAISRSVAEPRRISTCRCTYSR
jgi:hypothetical protein